MVVDGPIPAPPGTEIPTFWQRDSTKGAIVVTIGIALSIIRPFIYQMPISPDLIVGALENCVWAWAAALGLDKMGTDTLKWK